MNLQDTMTNSCTIITGALDALDEPVAALTVLSMAWEKYQKMHGITDEQAKETIKKTKAIFAAANMMSLFST